jgi:hypothetical protein
MMSIGFDKTFASQAPAKVRPTTTDGRVLEIAALALLAMIVGLMAVLPVAPGGDVAAAFPLYGL